MANAMHVAVICELLAGSTWADVAVSLGMDEHLVRERYADVLTRWLAGEPAPWRPTLAAGVEVVLMPDPPVDYDRVDAALERWCHRTGWPWPRDVDG